MVRTRVVRALPTDRIAGQSCAWAQILREMVKEGIRSSRSLVDPLLGQIVQKFIGLLFVLERLSQQLRGILEAKVSRPTAESSIPGDLIILPLALRR
jgi:hypothetical protein